MHEHHIQRDIIHKLVLSDSLRFADLRPREIDSNVVTYHLQQLMKQKLVVKNDAGRYELTELGKVAGINSTLTRKELLEQAHSILLMCLRDGDSWLLRRRKAQPMFNKIGFVHAEPQPGVAAIDTATEIFKDRTGLSASFSPRGFGYIKLVRGEALESFVHFTLFEATEWSGTIIETKRNGDNFWLKNPDFSAEDMIPSMIDMVQCMQESQTPFYLDKTYNTSTK